jgi:hypothetical protein
MHTLWIFHRRLTAAGLIVALLAISAGGALVLAYLGAPQGKVSGAKSFGHAVLPSGSPGLEQPSRRLKATPEVNPAQTAVQGQIDAELAAAETPTAIAAAQSATVPSPAASNLYPSIPTADRSDPAAYAIAFATELLDTNYQTQSRSALLAWAEHEEAPNSLPGVPASVAGKALVLSLADPGLPGGTPSPTPSAAQWMADTSDGESQLVSGVQTEVDPDWTQIISQGWQPRDPLMTIETVTGNLTVSTRGQLGPPASFSLTLTVGSAAHLRAGYGAVAAGDWTVG